MAAVDHAVELAAPLVRVRTLYDVLRGGHVSTVGVGAEALRADRVRRVRDLLPDTHCVARPALALVAIACLVCLLHRKAAADPFVAAAKIGADAEGLRRGFAHGARGPAAPHGRLESRRSARG